MKELYTVKYRQPGQWFWRTVRRVKGDGTEPRFRWFHKENDTVIFVSLNAEIKFSPARQKVIEHRMSKEAGQPVQRA